MITAEHVIQACADVDADPASFVEDLAEDFSLRDIIQIPQRTGRLAAFEERWRDFCSSIATHSCRDIYGDDVDDDIRGRHSVGAVRALFLGFYVGAVAAKLAGQPVTVFDLLWVPEGSVGEYADAQNEKKRSGELPDDTVFGTGATLNGLVEDPRSSGMMSHVVGSYINLLFGPDALDSFAEEMLQGGPADEFMKISTCVTAVFASGLSYCAIVSGLTEEGNL